MIEHIVLMKKKPEASDADMDRVLDALRGLKDQVPGVVALTAGANFNQRGGGFTHGLYVRFVDRNALGVYVAHPAHKAAVRLLDETTPERVVVDWEV